VTDIVIESTHANHKIPVRLYEPIERPLNGTTGLLIWVHGGGWTLGSISTDDFISRKLVKVRQARMALCRMCLPEHGHVY
jgi:acetyl esterase/lipase